MHRLRSVRPVMLAIMVASFGGTALAYDDPAVAVCQFTKFHGDDPAATGFKRLSARIENQKVFIEWERSVLNTAPKTETQECWFREEAGYFHVIDAIQAQKDHCTFLENAARRTEASDEERSTWEQREAACLALYSEPAVSWYEFDHQTIQPLSKTGIYPISIVDTKMRVSQ